MGLRQELENKLLIPALFSAPHTAIIFWGLSNGGLKTPEQQLGFVLLNGAVGFLALAAGVHFGRQRSRNWLRGNETFNL